MNIKAKMSVFTVLRIITVLSQDLNILVYYYTLQYVSAVWNSHRQVEVGYAKKKYKGRESSLYNGLNYNNILFFTV
jgi:hypothetical protein